LPTSQVNIWFCQVRAAAVFALGNLTTLSNCPDDDSDDDEKVKAEINVVRSLLQISSDGSPLVRSEVAIGMHWKIRLFFLEHLF
jgi:regulatory associated protein of mTOR